MTPFLLILMIFILSLVYRSLNSTSNKSILSEFWIKFQTTLVEDPTDEQWSANRVAYIMTMFISNFIIWGGILYVIVTTFSFPDVPSGVIVVYGIANGVSSAAKVFQKREERIMQQQQLCVDDSDTSKRKSIEK